MKKFFSLIAAVLFAGSMMADVVFTKDDFAGQGTANTGSEVSATKDGVTFTYSKGYCADESLRCYAHGALSITASSTISKIQFTTTGGKTGGLDAEVTVNATSYSVADLASQARFTEIRVLFDGEGGEGGEGETITLDVAYAEAAYLAEYGAWQFNLYKDYNEETEVVTYPDLYVGVYAKSATAIAGTYSAESEIAFIEVDVAEGTTVEATSSSDLVVTHLGEGVYRYELTFVGDDGKTYKLDASLETPAYDSETYADIELDEDGGEVVPPTPDELATEGIHTLTPVKEDAAGAGTYSKIIDGIQLEWTGAYYETDFRAYAGNSFVITAGAKIEKVEIAGLAKKGLAIVVSAGEVTTGASFDSETTKGDIEDPLIVIENIDAESLTIACNKQLQARIIRVTLEGGQGIEDILSEGKAVKVLVNGQVVVKKGGKTYNMNGAVIR